ncbi:MAG: Mur ligase family protein [Actinobacteria bacterium]|nr:Mur ligase family protein [Actinomycetota bacterium]
MSKSLRLGVATAVGELAGLASRALGRGRGESIRGQAILSVDPQALAKLAQGRDIVLVTGTNGKTTTTANLARILAVGTGEAVSTSEYGANMRSGIVSALAAKPRNRYVVLECDELYIPQMYQALKPKVIVLLNLSRDQLHRTGEVRKVAQLWHDTFTRDDVTLVIDRDDPFLEYAVANAGHVVRVTFGGRKHPDAATCPKCSELLDWSLGDYRCACGLGSELAQVRGERNLSGPARNSVLAVEAARLMGAVVPVELVVELMANPPDRVADNIVAGRVVHTRLAKNPESWRTSLAQVHADNVILAVNARGIDGRDTSWLWDVDYSGLAGKNVVCVSERRRDVAYRLSVQGIVPQVVPTFADAVALFDDRPIDAVASYTAFQDLAGEQMGLNVKTGGRT